MSKVYTKEKENHIRIVTLIYILGTKLLQVLLERTATKSYNEPTLRKVLLNKRAFQKIQQYCAHDHTLWEAIYGDDFPNKNDSYIIKLKDCDITILFFLIKTLCGLKKPSLGWHSWPLEKEDTLEAHTVRIKNYRNKYAHKTYSLEVKDEDFEKHFTELKDAYLFIVDHLQDLDSDFEISESDIETFRFDPIGQEQEDKVKYILDEWAENDKQTIQLLLDIANGQLETNASLEQLKVQQYNQEASQKDRDLELSELNGKIECLKKDLNTLKRVIWVILGVVVAILMLIVYNS